MLGLALLLSVVGAVAAAADSPPPQRPMAGCVYLPAQHILAVTIKKSPGENAADPGDELNPPGDGQAYVARSGEMLGVFGGPDATPVGCVGGQATVRNTDYILVRAGDRVERPEVAIDMRRGLLAPGFTDERDGASEIEVFTDLGRRGRVVVATTSGADDVTIGPRATGEVVNVNAGEAVDDPDVFGRPGAFLVYGGAGPDRIDAAASRGAKLIGGGGPDLLVGSARTDLLQGDGGADVLLAGAGTDIVLGLDRVADRIDCGAGNDIFVVVDPADLLAGCERTELEDPLADRRAAADRLAGRQALLATPLPAVTASGRTQNDPSAKP